MRAWRICRAVHALEWLGLVLAALLALYLGYAMLRPERFQ